MAAVDLKVELHRHLDCSMRPSTLRELLEIQGELHPQTSEREFRQNYLIEEPMTDLKSVLQKFTASQRALNSGKVLRRLTRETIEDAAADGVRLLELRFSPSYICENHPQLSFEIALEGILKGISDCNHMPVAVGLIAIIQRIKSVAEAERVLNFVLAHRNHFIGVDLADQEEGFDGTPFESLFDRAHSEGLGITIHAGESPSHFAEARIKYAVEKLHATRIGHGIQCIHFPGLTDWLMAKGVHLEVCPTSNVLTQSVKSIASHPIRQLFEKGLSISINTDDPGIFATDLTHEYELLRKTHSFTADEFCRINQMACQSSFLPAAIRTTVSTALSKSASS